ncbi:MAG: MBL fold metallo-hydrolase [Gammaproteobacteria bacterium]|nr:MBL fold metallo-hydrolase [Gammaproteobacteria bacterium]
MQLTFLGATGTVTGSRYLLSVGSKEVLIDCGLFQGYKELRLRNWEKFPVDPCNIDAVVLTHAHIDHTGYLPLLVKKGYAGPIYSTPATKDLCSILLPDSGYLQEEEARLANKYGYSKHKPALPLYTKEDGLNVLKQFHTVDYDTQYPLFEQLSFRFFRAGHILGSSFIEFKKENTSILFTGDIGRSADPVMRERSKIQSTDYLVIESTYGDRLHATQNPQKQLGELINQTAKRGGSVIIPAFAVGRAQSLLFYISQLKSAGTIPDLPVFLDSPMATNVTDILCKYKNEHRLTEQQCMQLCDVAEYVNTPDESKKLDTYRMPIIIISASGMATGGRILHHLKVFLQDPLSTIILTGYQAGGTRGARIANGEKEIKIHGQMIPVRAHVESLSNLSAHADYQDILDWLSKFTKPPRKVFITHGEPKAALALKTKIEEALGFTCEVPQYLATEELT